MPRNLGSKVTTDGCKTPKQGLWRLESWGSQPTSSALACPNVAESKSCVLITAVSGSGSGNILQSAMAATENTPSNPATSSKATDSRALGSAMQQAPAGTDEDERAELCVFQVPVAYIYLPIPPASSYGHRAELWDVEKWFQEVKLKMIFVGDEMYIRLEQQDTGELFAEAPLPSDGSPLTRAVEPVVDSSRYYVLRVVDRTNPKKHAFLGLGFRERSQSSGFSAALDEYRQYLRRKSEAEALRVAFNKQAEQTKTQDSEQGVEGSSECSKYKLTGSISLKLPGIAKSESINNGSKSDSESGMVRQVSAGIGSISIEDATGKAGTPKLMPPPPPPNTSRLLMPCPSGRPTTNAWAAFPEDGSDNKQSPLSPCDEDEWGDFK